MGRDRKVHLDALKMAGQRRALLVGIDKYDNFQDLRCAVADARRLDEVLKTNADGSPNFDARLYVGDGNHPKITRALLRQLMIDCFEEFAGDVVFYFSGHGVQTPWAGVLVTQDATPGEYGECAATGSFADTFPLLRLYELRSSLVHGSEIGICGDAHYRFLVGNLLRLLQMQAEFLNEHPEINTFAKFVKAVETPELLAVALRWSEPLGDEADVLTAEVKRRLPPS